MLRIEGFEPAVALAADDAEAYRRRFVTLFADEASSRRGGLGRVVNVMNALGETFALKTLIEEAGALPADMELRRAAFDEEYGCQRALSGLKGFPRLYGRGTVCGAPAIVMEWIEGETLAAAARELAVDESGRLSPLTAARLGRDLFDLICRMDLVGEGLVHRDVSPANVMVRTGLTPVRAQAEDGAFDLALIDFGSSALEGGGPADTPFTSAYSVMRRATAPYAAPEMLSDDVPGVAELRRQGAVDVYEAASVLFELVAGVPPFAPDEGEAPVASLYRRKVDAAPRVMASAHAEGADLAALLAREPEVALAAGEVALALGVDPGSERLRRALALVDTQLEDLVRACLAPEQARRPSAGAMRDALAGFCAHYAQNVGRALRGQVLIPCTGEASWLDSMTPYRLRSLLRMGGKALAGAVGLFSVVSASLLLAGAPAALALPGGGVVWAGRLSGLTVAAGLVAPALLGLAARGRSVSGFTAFMRGSLVLAGTAALAAVLAAGLALDPAERTRGLHAAMFATFAAAWFPLVLDYATTGAPAYAGEVRRRLEAARRVGLPERDRARAGDAASPAVRGGAADVAAADTAAAVTLPLSGADPRTLSDRSSIQEADDADNE